VAREDREGDEKAVTEAEKKAKRVELGHRLLQATQGDDWKNVIRPYIEGERDLQQELILSQVDAMQVMRYAGAVQALSSLLNLEVRAKQAVEEAQTHELKRFS